jgi:hypothetical protein
VVELSYSLLACYGLIVMFFQRPRLARVDDLLDPEFLGGTKRRAQQQTAAGRSDIHEVMAASIGPSRFAWEPAPVLP